MNSPQVSIILPCFNEEKAIQFCIDQLKSVIKNDTFVSEVIVVNNNSTDKSKSILEANLADFKELRILNEPLKGYGRTYLKGLSEAKGTYIFMTDCDGTYDFNEMPNFIRELKNGSDLVVGNRFARRIPKGAMPFSHKYIGNPLLSLITRKLFSIKIHDIHCGARALKKEALSKVSLNTEGMEFASEMIVKFEKAGLKISEVPIAYYKRIGKSKLEAVSDGLRHLRFLFSNMSFNQSKS